MPGLYLTICPEMAYHNRRKEMYGWRGMKY